MCIPERGRDREREKEVWRRKEGREQESREKEVWRRKESREKESREKEVWRRKERVERRRGRNTHSIFSPPNLYHHHFTTCKHINIKTIIKKNLVALQHGLRMLRCELVGYILFKVPMLCVCV